MAITWYGLGLGLEVHTSSAAVGITQVSRIVSGVVGQKSGY